MKIINWKILSILLVALNYNVLSAKQIITEQQATDLVKTFVQSIKDGNVDKIDELLDENYTHIHGTGLIENKQDTINALKNKTRIYNVADVSDIKITQLGNVAYATAKLNIKVTTAKGNFEALNMITIIMHNNKNHKDKKDKGKKHKNNLTISQFQATKVG